MKVKCKTAYTSASLPLFVCVRVVRYVQDVTFTEKLRRLTEGESRAAISRKAGLSSTAVNDYLQRGYVPRIDNALGLARALNVSLEWLADDAQDWPPPTTNVGSEGFTTERLSTELGMRMRPIGVLLLEKIVAAEMINWINIAHDLLSVDPSSVPKHIADAIELLGQISLMRGELRHFDPHAAVGTNLSTALSKHVLPEFEISVIDLWQRSKNLENKDGLRQAMDLGSLIAAPEKWRTPCFKDLLDAAREKASVELEQLATDSPKPGSSKRRGR